MTKNPAAVVLPPIAGKAIVSFKNEGSAGGCAFGPVTVIDVSAFKAACWDNGLPIPGGKDFLGVMRPFGVKLDGEYDLGWHPLRVAHVIAKHYKAQLVKT